MTANYTDTGIDLEIHDTATRTSLIWLRERVQSHIDAMPPTLEEPEAVTIQSGPVQVVESEPEWSKWYDWSGGENPVGRCVVDVTFSGHHYFDELASGYRWTAQGVADITRYRVKLSSIPEGCQLSDSGILRGIPKADWPELHKARTLPDGYVWAGYGDNGEVVQGSLVMRDEVEGVHIKEAKKCFKILFYAIPTNAPQADFDRFTRDRA